MVKKTIFIISILLYFISFFFIYFNKEEGDKYPKKPITIIIHSKPGSGIDLMARKFADIAKKYSKTPFVIENRTGTQGIVAMKYIMDQKSDGYHILGVTKSFISTIIVNKSGVDIDDLYFAGIVLLDPEVLIVNRSAEINNIDKIISHKNKQIWIGPGTGGRDHLMALKCWEKLKINGSWVDYKSGPQSILAIMRKEGDVYVGNPAEIIGKKDLKIAAIASKKRLKYFKDVVTFEEKGFPIYEYMWRGFAFKRGIPDEAKIYFQNLLKKVTKDPEWISYIDSTYAIPTLIVDKEFQQMIKKEKEETVSVLKKIGLLKNYQKKGAIPIFFVAISIILLIFLLMGYISKFKLSNIDAESIVIAIFLFLGIFFLYQTSLFDLPDNLNITSPATIPRIWSITLIILIFYYLFKSDKNSKKIDTIGNKKTLFYTFITFIIYLFLMKYIGFYILTPIFLIVMFHVLNYKDRYKMVIISSFFTLFAFFVFKNLLHISLPMGKFLL